MNNRLKARFSLIKNMNCALATMEAMQDIMGVRDDILIKTVTGLEGGVVASGSTCGVLTAGALSLALMNTEGLRGGDSRAEATLLILVREYVDWFQKGFNSTACSKRSGVDFYSLSGQLRYFFPGDRVVRCINHIGKAVDFLQSKREIGLTPFNDNEKYPSLRADEKNHCAREVLQGVREKTGVGSRLIEDLSVVFDGGLGLTGDVCGALVGAIMAINLVFGMDVRARSYPGIIKDFITGHLNLLRKRPKRMPEPFGVGKDIVSGFRNSIWGGETACREITGREFTDYQDFQIYIAKSAECRDLISLSIDLSSRAIEEWR